MIYNIFADFDEEFLKFNRVESKLSSRPDLHAFILLNQLLPGDRDMVAGATHDEIYLDVSEKRLIEVATRDQLRDLHRCGVRHTSDGICMFV